MKKQYPASNGQDVYNQLGSFGLSGRIARLPVKFLSGGQRVRLTFALLLMESPHALLLDEPTNHLDLDAISAMTESLCNFSGSVVIVSHDLYFVKRIANDGVYAVGAGKISLISDMEAWLKKLS